MAQAQAGLAVVQQWVQGQGLRLHSDQTQVGDCREAGQGFDFLGHRFEAGQRRVRRKSIAALRERIGATTGRSRGDRRQRIIADLNPLLKGWFGYFKHAHSMTFNKLDGFLRRRLRALLRKQQHRPGRGCTWADHSRWSNAFFAAQGLFTITEAHALASPSR